MRRYKSRYRAHVNLLSRGANFEIDFNDLTVKFARRNVRFPLPCMRHIALKSIYRCNTSIYIVRAATSGILFNEIFAYYIIPCTIVSYISKYTECCIPSYGYKDFI